MTEVGIAIIGAGYMGRTHAAHYAALPGVRVLGVCDVDQGAAERLAEAMGPGTVAVTDLDKLFAVPGLDAVSICTPDGDHRSPAQAAASAGLHILLEKPLATTSADAYAILDAAAAANVTLAMGFVSRYLRTYSAAREAVTTGAVGTVTSIGVRRFNTQQAGAKYCHRDDVIDFLAVHDIDILRWFGGEISSVTALADTFVFTQSHHADTVQMLARFASGAIGHLHVSWALPDVVPPYKGRSGIDVVGTAGTVAMDSLDDRVHVSAVGAAPYPIDWDLSGAFRDQIATFVDCVRGTATPRATGIDGLRALQVVQAVKRSVAEGGSSVTVTAANR